MVSVSAVTVRSAYRRVSDEAQLDIPVPMSESVVPDGIRIVAVLDEALSTTTAREGDLYTMTTRSPSEYEGAVIQGVVSAVNESGRLTGRSSMSLGLGSIRLRNGTVHAFDGTIEDIRMPDGGSVRVNHEGTAASDETRTQKTVERGAIGAALGAIIGAIAGGGKGAAIGAVIGAGGGAGTVMIEGRDRLDLQRGTAVTIISGGSRKPADAVGRATLTREPGWQTEEPYMRPGRPTSVSHPATGRPGSVAGGVASPGRAGLAVTFGRKARRLVARLTATRRRRIALLLSVLLPAALFLPPAAWIVHHVYFDRTDVPDLTAFLRFEPLTTGVVRDARGAVLVELAREYRRVVTYDEVPVILRQAILAAEDKRFFSHSGVDYRALPRVVQKTAARSISEWWKGGGLRLLLPQGGSTLTQQLVRGYFLADLTRRSDRRCDLPHRPRSASTPLLVLGASATNKLLRKLEEVRLTLWLEREMRRRYGTQEQAKREIFGRYASFIYLGNGRYGFAAASEYYFARTLSSYTPDDAGIASLLSAISKAPRDYAPAPGNLRLIRRRNQILALMARYGYISEALATRCQGEPIRVAPVAPDKTDAPAAIDHVLTELSQRAGTGFGVEDLFEGRVVGPIDGGRSRAGDRE